MSAEEQVRLDNFDSIFSLDGKVAVVTGGSRGLGLHFLLFIFTKKKKKKTVEMHPDRVKPPSGGLLKGLHHLP